MIMQNFGEPRDPNRLMSLSYFITSIGAGFLLANNWQRLGKPEWAQPTRILSVVIPVLSLIIVVGMIAFVSSSSYPKDVIGLLLPVAFTAFGLNFGLMFALVTMQRPAYKQWKNGGAPALTNYTFNLRRGVTVFVVFLVGSILFGAVLSVVISHSS